MRFSSEEGGERERDGRWKRMYERAKRRKGAIWAGQTDGQEGEIAEERKASKDRTIEEKQDTRMRGD
jgi:hypothetical protein